MTVHTKKKKKKILQEIGLIFFHSSALVHKEGNEKWRGRNHGYSVAVRHTSKINVHTHTQTHTNESHTKLRLDCLRMTIIYKYISFPMW